MPKILDTSDKQLLVIAGVAIGTYLALDAVKVRVNRKLRKLRSAE